MRKNAGDAARTKELYQQARDRMAALLPGWSDERPSDPAVAVLELAARLSDLQERTFGRVGDRHWLAYTKLLGGTPEEAALAVLLARPLERTGLHRGQRFQVDGVPFEVEDAGRDLGEVERVSLRVDGAWTAWAGPGPLAVRGDGLEAVFSRPLPPGETARLWCGLRPEPGRIPPDGETAPPVRVRALAWCGGAWEEIPVRDGTCGLLKSGFWTFAPEKACGAVRLELCGDLEGEPQIEALVLEPALLIQRRTRSLTVDLAPPFAIPEGLAGNYILRFFLPEPGGGWREAPAVFAADGRAAGWQGRRPEAIRLVAQEPDLRCDFPLREIAGERISLDEDGILPRSLALMAEEDGVWYDCPVGEPGPEGDKLGCRWSPARRELCFGDGRDFPIPRAGRLTVSACVCTLGSAGNGAEGVLRDGETVLSILAPSAGGRDRELPQDAFLRAVREQAEPLRAVTPADLKEMALRTPGLALAEAQCSTRRGEAGAVVRVRPRSGPLTPWRRGCVQAWLERSRPLGVPVEVEELR